MTSKSHTKLAHNQTKTDFIDYISLWIQSSLAWVRHLQRWLIMKKVSVKYFEYWAHEECCWHTENCLLQELLWSAMSDESIDSEDTSHTITRAVCWICLCINWFLSEIYSHIHWFSSKSFSCQHTDISR